MVFYSEIDCTEAAALITAERLRQIDVEGYSLAHDNEHQDGELEKAASCYRNWALDSIYPHQTCCHLRPGKSGIPLAWPWADSDWKPSGGPKRCLVKAGALLQAEVERLTRRGGYQGHLNSKILLIRQELQKLLDMEASRNKSKN